MSEGKRLPDIDRTSIGLWFKLGEWIRERNEFGAKVERLEQQVEALMETLEPFTNLVTGWRRGSDDMPDTASINTDGGATVGDVRRARAALAATSSAEEPEAQTLAPGTIWQCSDHEKEKHVPECQINCPCLDITQCGACREHNFGTHDTYAPNGAEDYFSHCPQCTTTGCGPAPQKLTLSERIRAIDDQQPAAETTVCPCTAPTFEPCGVEHMRGIDTDTLMKCGVDTHFGDCKRCGGSEKIPVPETKGVSDD